MFRVLVMLITSAVMIACADDLQNATPNVTVDSAYSPSPDVKSSSPHAEPPETGEPAMHAVQNSRLEVVMHQINYLVYDQLNNEINLSKGREAKMAEIAHIAAELAESEKSIVDTLPSLKLNSDEQFAFLALAEKLRVSAINLQKIAAQNQFQSIPTTFETITNTCISCHSLFRKSRSLLEKCKDPRYTC